MISQVPQLPQMSSGLGNLIGVRWLDAISLLKRERESERAVQTCSLTTDLLFVSLTQILWIKLNLIPSIQFILKYYVYLILLIMQDLRAGVARMSRGLLMGSA